MHAWAEGGNDIPCDGLRRPTVRTMHGADGPYGIEEKYLVLAHPKYLSCDIPGATRTEKHHHGSDLGRRHAFQPLEPHSLDVTLRGNGFDHAAPRERCDAVGSDAVALHVK